MKRILLLIAVCVQVFRLSATGDFNPTNPGNPSPAFNLEVKVSPEEGGIANVASTTLYVGQKLSLSVSQNKDYVFKQWICGDKVLSTSASFSFTMPDSNTIVTAQLEYAPQPYNPTSPPDPSAPEIIVKHTATIEVSPVSAGSVTYTSMVLKEGEQRTIYASANASFTFDGWYDGDVLLSKESPYILTMADQDIALTARFRFTPASPADPDAPVLPDLTVIQEKDTLSEGDEVEIEIHTSFAVETDERIYFRSTYEGTLLSLPDDVVMPAGETVVRCRIRTMDDTEPRMKPTATVTVYGAHYANAATIRMVVEDNDIPNISLTLSKAVVLEDAGLTALTATVQLAAPAAGDLSIRLTDDSNGSLYYATRNISLKKNQTQAVVQMGVINNKRVDGDRTVTITAAVYIPSCHCTPTPPATGTDTKTLLLLDDDLPELAVSIDNTMLLEGLENAALLTISRNTTTDTAMYVLLTADITNNLLFPDTVWIPAGKESEQVSISVSRNYTEEDSHDVIFLVASPGFIGSSCRAMVIDQNLPDAVVSGLTISSTTVEAGDSVMVSVTVYNRGAAGLAKGVTVCLYASPLQQMLTGIQLSQTLSVNSSVVLEQQVAMPASVGRYTLYAVVNEERQVKELHYTNNRSEEMPVIVTSPCHVLSITTDRQVCMPGDTVTISGRMEGSRSKQMPMEIYAINNGYRNAFTVTTDNEGYFSGRFCPEVGRAGHFAIGVCYPSEGLDTEMAGVDYYGLSADKRFVTCQMLKDIPYEGKLNITNKGSLPLHNVRVEIPEPQTGYTCRFDTVKEIAGGASLEIPFTILSDTITEGINWLLMPVRIISDESVSCDMTVYLYCRSAQGRLECSISSIETTVSVQEPRDISFTLVNTGLGKTGDISLGLPEWIEPVTPRFIPSLATDETTDITLRIVPNEMLTEHLNLHITGYIGFNPSNCEGIRLPFTISPVSTNTGELRVDVCDEYTYYTDEHPHVEGAQVLVKDIYSHAVVTQGITNSDGVLDVTLPEGYYDISVTANNHDAYTNTVLVNPEDVTEVLVNLSVRAITVNWEVVETEVEDEYDIVTTVEYKTHVPMPVVVVESPDSVPVNQLQENESLVFNLTITNQGLIRAEDVTITLPHNSEDMLIEPLAYGTPFNLEAKQTVIMPVRVTRVQFPKPAPSREKDDNNLPHLRCKNDMFCLYYWDCGPDRKWHQYSKPLFPMPCSWIEKVASILPDSVTIRNVDLPDPPISGCKSGCGGGSGGYAADPLSGKDYVCTPYTNTRLLEWISSFTSVVLFGVSKTAKVVGLISKCLLQIPNLNACIRDGLLNYSETADIKSASLKCLRSGWGVSAINTGVSHLFPNLLYWPIGEIVAHLYKSIVPDYPTPVNDVNGRRTLAESDNDPAYFKRFKERALVAANTLDAMHRMICFYVTDDILSYSSDEEITDLLDLWDIQLTAPLPAEAVATYKPAALPDSLWENMLIRMENTYLVSQGQTIQSNNYVHTDSILKYMQVIDDCQSQAEEWGYTSVAEMFEREFEILKQAVDEESSSSVCASVTLQFDQQMVMTRQAFRGTLTVSNGHESVSMTDMHLTLNVADSDGRQATEHEFHIELEKLERMSGEASLDNEDGWSVEAGATGVVTILFIPTKNAAPTEDRIYSFGGQLSYTDPYTGLTVTRNLYPVQLTVSPSPQLQLTYFMQRDVYADDPLTDEMEEAEAAEFALLINNIGYGDAKQLRLTTNSPQIVENEKGLLINFSLDSARLNGKQTILPIDAKVKTDFGTVPAQQQAYAQWYFSSTLLGHFTDFDVEATHITSYGNADLTLLDKVSVHEMIRSIRTPSQVSSQGIGWLVNDDMDADAVPERLYKADGNIEPVAEAIATFQRQDAQTGILTLTPQQAGWNYARTNDLTAGKQRIRKIVRMSDQTEISPRNVWQTPCVLHTSQDPLHIPYIHIADYVTTEEQYQVSFTPADIEVPTHIETEKAADVRIYTIDNRLYVRGINGNYHVYSTSGQLVYYGSGNMCLLPAKGVYIVRFNGLTMKAVAR